jgi:hypothetical protein
MYNGQIIRKFTGVKEFNLIQIGIMLVYIIQSDRTSQKPFGRSGRETHDYRLRNNTGKSEGNNHAVLYVEHILRITLH